MPREYIIEIGQDSPYPFSGPKLNFPSIFVRTSIHTSTPQYVQQIHQRIDLFSKIKSCAYIIQIHRVVQTNKNQFIIDYEYVAQPYKSQQKFITDNLILPTLKQQLLQICQLLSVNGIWYEFKMTDIGMNQQGIPKLFIGLKFKVVKGIESKKLYAQYQVYIDKFIEQNFNFRNVTRQVTDSLNISDYSQRWDKKLNEIEDKLQKRYMRKSFSKSSNSDKSKSKETLTGNIVIESIAQRQNNNGSLTPNFTSNSCISGFKNKTKIHKSSFGDYSTTSYRLNEEQEDSLTKRVTNALQRTQTAFKIYEKYTKRR